MIVKREGENKYSKPIIKEEHINFIREQYQKGYSQIDISNQMNISSRLVSKLMKDNNITIRTNREQALKHSFNENYFETIDSEEKAYWLGFMYADGYIQNKRKHSGYRIGITLSSVDKDHLEKFNQSLKSTYDIKTYKSNGGYSVGNFYSRIIVSSDKMASDLIKKGCILNKTDKLMFPNSDIVRNNLIKHFIRGYIDGDGSLNYSFCKNNRTNRHNKFESKIGIVGTRDIVEGILNTFELNHLKLDKRYKSRDNDNFQVNIGGNRQVERLLDYLYLDSKIYLERKYQKYLEIKSKYNSYLVELSSNR